MSTQTAHRITAALKLPSAVSALISLARAVIAAMSNNNSFPSPNPSLATVSAGLADLESAEAAALARTKGAVASRNQKRVALVALLQLLKGYVQSVADASPDRAAAIIQSAAMEVRKVPVRAKRVFGIKQGAVSGSVIVVTASAGHRAAYDWETSIDGGKTWQLAPSTMQAKTTFSGLVPGSTFMVRYRALTKGGEGDWVQPISYFVK